MSSESKRNALPCGSGSGRPIWGEPDAAEQVSVLSLPAADGISTPRMAMPEA